MTYIHPLYQHVISPGAQRNYQINETFCVAAMERQGDRDIDSDQSRMEDDTDCNQSGRPMEGDSDSDQGGIVPPLGEDEAFVRQDSSGDRTALVQAAPATHKASSDPTRFRADFSRENEAAPSLQKTDDAKGDRYHLASVSDSGSIQPDTSLQIKQSMVIGTYPHHVTATEDDPSPSAASYPHQQHGQVSSSAPVSLPNKAVGSIRVPEEEVEEDPVDLKKRILNVLRSITRWNEEKGFGPDHDESEKIKILMFLRLATKLNRCGVYIDYCVRCGCSKKPVGDGVVPKKPVGDGVVPKSHIWPQAVLNIMGKTHYEDPEFIRNLTDGKLMGAKGLTGRLLCSKCETGDSKHEKWLRNLYLTLLSKEGSYQLAIKNDDNWLKRVLVKVMFLGIVINIKLPHGAHFDDVFIDLWRYYRYGKSSIDLRLFLLPSDAFCPISKLTFCLESALRNIGFTSIVQREDGMFLYTQCDIFHVVLPMDGYSRDLFNCYYNCFPSEATSGLELVRVGNIWHGFSKAMVRTDHRTESYRSPKGITFQSEDPLSSFPMELIKENADRIPDLVLKLVAELQKEFVDKKDEASVTHFPGRKSKYPHEIPHTEYPSTLQSTSKDGVMDSNNFDPVKLSKQQNEDLLDAAKKLSPIRSSLNKQIDDLKAKLAAAEKRNNKVERERDDYKERERMCLVLLEMYNLQT